jgi:FAD/FMN-containing dehydrogenase
MAVPVALLASLRAELGPEGVLEDPTDTAPYVEDWSGARRGSTSAVLRPATTAEVATAVRLCHEAGVALVPQGGNTGLAGGSVPDESGGQLVLSLTRLRAVRDVDPVADTMTVEAGVVLADAQQAAADAGRLFPLSLASEGSCTVGGTIATNAGGTAVLRYGMARDLVLGLEVVLPDGRVWDGLRGLRKDNTGYDLKQLFIGSEGSLGVVTAAVLRLFPATPRRATAWLALPSVRGAVSVLEVVRRRAGPHLSTWELVSRQAVDLVLEHLPDARDPFGEAHPWYGLVELRGTDTDSALDGALEAAIGEAVERELVSDAVIAGNASQRASLWSLREGVSEAHRRAGPGLRHDVTLPIADLAEFVEEVGPRLDVLVPGVRLVTFGHVGDGNLHFNLTAPVGGAADESFVRRGVDLTKTVYDAVAAHGGSISAEHGLGTIRRDAAASYKSEVELDLMRSVKQALDPTGLMNPGKVLPDRPVSE